MALVTASKTASGSSSPHTEPSSSMPRYSTPPFVFANATTVLSARFENSRLNSTIGPSENIAPPFFLRFFLTLILLIFLINL